MRSVKIRGVSLRLELLCSDSKGQIYLFLIRSYLLYTAAASPLADLSPHSMIYRLAGEQLLRTLRSQVTLYAT